MSSKFVEVTHPTIPNLTIHDNLTTTSSTEALSANQGKVLKDLIDTKLDASSQILVMDTLDSTSASNALSANQGKILKDLVDTKLDSTAQVSVIDALDNTSTSSALSANQGKVLKGYIDSKFDGVDQLIIVDDLNSSSNEDVLSANQGRVLKGMIDTKLDTSAQINIIDDLESSSADSALSANQGKILKDLVDTKLDSSAQVSVIDALDNSSTDSALSANQGKVLKDLVDTKLDSADQINVIDSLDNSSTDSALSANQGKILKSMIESASSSSLSEAIIYIDSTDGNDDTGNGTQESPYRTIGKGYQMAPTFGNVTLRLCADRTYDVTDELSDIKKGIGGTFTIDTYYTTSPITAIINFIGNVSIGIKINSEFNFTGNVDKLVLLRLILTHPDSNTMLYKHVSFSNGTSFYSSGCTYNKTHSNGCCVELSNISYGYINNCSFNPIGGSGNSSSAIIAKNNTILKLYGTSTSLDVTDCFYYDYRVESGSTVYVSSVDSFINSKGTRVDSTSKLFDARELTLYVNGSVSYGSNAAPNGTISKPFTTILEAMNYVSSRNSHKASKVTLNLAPGIYQTSFINNQTFSELQFTLWNGASGNGTDAIITTTNAGSSFSLTNMGGNYIFDRVSFKVNDSYNASTNTETPFYFDYMEKATLTFDTCKFIGNTSSFDGATGKTPTAVTFTRCPNVTMKNCTFSNWKRAIHVRDKSMVTFNRNSNFTDTNIKNAILCDSSIVWHNNAKIVGSESNDSMINGGLILDSNTNLNGSNSSGSESSSTGTTSGSVALGLGRALMNSIFGTTWATKTLPTNLNITSSAYSPELEKYIIASDGTYIIYHSLDGTTYTAGTNLGYGNLNAPMVIWVPTIGKFILTGISGAVLTSPDGLSWTRVLLPSAMSSSYPSVIEFVPELNKIFMFYNVNTTYYATSTDGTNWELKTLPLSAQYSSFTYAPRLNMIMVMNTNTRTYLTSTDGGSTWTSRTLNKSGNNYPYPTSYKKPLCWSEDHGLFAYIQANTQYIFTSKDAITWTERTTTTTFSGTYSNSLEMRYIPQMGVFCASTGIAGNVQISCTGIGGWKQSATHGQVYTHFQYNYHNGSLMMFASTGINILTHTVV